MPTALDLAPLIPLIPFLGSSFIGILLLSFNRTMNRLSKPVAFVLITCASTSAILSYLLLAQEYTNEVTNTFSLGWPLSSTEIGLHLDFIIDKFSSIILSVISTAILLLMIFSHYYMKKRKGYVTFFVYISLLSASLLALPITTFARSRIDSLIA